ncbi:CrcB family protein [bacterium]|nr:CrcB family protein [bacterium]
MVALWIVAIGGACGSLLRYVISEFVTRLSAGIFPWGTMSVNLIGSFAIGVVWQLVENGS